MGWNEQRFAVGSGMLRCQIESDRCNQYPRPLGSLVGANELSSDLVQAKTLRDGGGRQMVKSNLCVLPVTKADPTLLRPREKSLCHT
jgi:hypothetical protein